MARDLKVQVVLQALDRATRPMRTAMGSSIGLANSLKQTRDHLKGLQAQQRDVSSFRTLSNATRRTGADLKASQDRVAQLSRQLRDTQTPTRALNTEFRRAVREAQALKAKHQEQQRTLQGLRSNLNSAGISTRNLGEHERQLRGEITRANQSLTQQEQRLRRVAQQQQRLARAAQQYQRTQQLASSMATTGAAGMAAGGGALYAGARFMAPGLEFDAAMAKVQSLARIDRNSEAYQLLREQARQLGASTQYTAGEAAGAQGFLAMAGFNPDAIRAAMPGMLSLAKAGDTDLAQTADIASNILSGFGLQADKMNDVGDVLVGTFSRSNTNLAMLGETMKYAAPVAAELGQDIQTVAAMAGKLAGAGIQGGMGGTTLRAIMSRVASGPKMAREALDALGVSAQDAQGNLRPMPDILRDIYNSTRNMGNAERAGYFKAIAGEEAVSGMGYLVNDAGSGELQSFISTLRQVQGESNRTASVMGDNLRGDLAALGSAWEDLGIEAMDGQNSALRELVQNLTAVIGKVKQWMVDNPELASGLIKTAAITAALVAGMGALTLGLASVIGPFAMLRYGLTFLGVKGGSAIGIIKGLGGALTWAGRAVLWLGRALMLNPIGLAITAIALGAYLIYKHWDKIVPYFKGLWAEIKAGFNGGFAGIAELIVNFSPVGLFYRAFSAVMRYFGVEMPERFTDYGRQMLAGLVNGITNGLGAVKSAITGAGEQMVGWFKDKLGIHSPSRVFASLGDDTMAGLQRGLQRSQGGPLSAVLGAGQAMVKAGALALGIGGAGQAVAIDSRPPISAAGGPSVVVQGDTLHIQLSAPAGADLAQIEQLFNRLLDQRERHKAARVRSALSDYD